MFIKKAIHTWRNKVVTIFQILLPVLATIIALAVDSSSQDEKQEPSLTFDLKPFSDSISAYGESVNSTETTELADKYGGLFGAGETAERLTPQQAQNFSIYFVDKAKELRTAVYNNKMVIGADFSVINTTITSIKGFYNGLPYHAPPISVSFMMNALARQVFGDDTVRITTRNHPLPPDVKTYSEEAAFNSNTSGFTVALCLVFGMCFLASSLSVFLIKERQVGAKHLQKVSGVGTLVYWLSNITWDFINYLIPCILIVIVFASFGTDGFVSGSNLSYVFLVLLVFGLAVIPCVYMLQFLFNTPPGGMAAILILNVLSGLITVMAVFILRIPSLKTQDIADILEYVFSVPFPQFNLGIAFMNIVDNYNNLKICANSSPCDGIRFNPCCKDTCGGLCYYYSDNYLSFDRPGIGKNVLLLVVQSLVFFFITLTIEAQLPQKVWYKVRPNSDEVEPLQSQSHTNLGEPQTDSDVANEIDRIKNMDMDQPKDSFVLKSLYKRYGNFVAVDHISVGIPDRECFGLLGQNGAGKTTTFKMLTGDVMVTSGNAFLKSNDIKSSIQKVQENMGYCPQFDALIDQMTGVETLYMYGRLKGIPGNHLKGVVNSLIDILMLKEHANKLTQAYSGGNKRKLSTAIALIGDPGFILLDEPSSGVDPKARRQLWTVLSKVRDSGKTLILTSHRQL
ncbi:phospholipid-transporting ATPase ABCA3 [Patella vulgata]|uniref:phospholipid-transporting ATPase ABCA3 n=1 Tax=Patella vulgata TaxID=6465 RepID=UPI0024A927D0|nr:phospholipid-transporting ATPase ABCA3 [Patella vulgata]